MLRLHCGMIDQTTPRFAAAIAEVLEPFGRTATLPLSIVDSAPVRLQALLASLPASPMSVRGGVRLDSARKLVQVGTQTIELTEKEALLLSVLMDAGGEMTREALLKHVWGYADNVDTHTLETHIHRVRTKLKPHVGGQDYIETTARGYRITPLDICP